ncbi:MAG: Gfo/Idh/MocA family oxidoreductase [Neptuniibacter sp.]
MKNFALIGAAGYIAPRHMKAIKETNNRLVAALDNNDSVGVIDSFFPEAKFFTEFERFDRHIDKLHRAKDEQKIDFISIASPNYLHDSHIRFALRSDSDAICEKPLVLNPWNIDGLIDLEKATGRKVNTILQLRLHPSILELKRKVDAAAADKKFDVDLTYITSRGNWYLQSWKGEEKKSGGIATNIGVHFYDMLQFVFGELQMNIVNYHTQTKASGYLEYSKARVRWFLSIDASDLPKNIREEGQRTYRSITCEGEEVEFSSGFTDLHTLSYQQILEGKGYRLEESRAAIETVSQIRTQEAIGLKGDYHPMLKGLCDGN